MTLYDMLVTACWLFGGIGLCILAATLIELSAIKPPKASPYDHDL